jgi:hypothetical protein
MNFFPYSLAFLFRVELTLKKIQDYVFYQNIFVFYVTYLQVKVESERMFFAIPTPMQSN